MAVVAAALVVATMVMARAALAASRGLGVRRRLAGTSPEGGDRLAGMLPEPPGWVGPRLDAAGVEVGPGVAWSGWLLALCGAAGVGVLLGGIALALLLAGALVIATALLLRSRRGRGDLLAEQALPGALEAVARSLRSGASLRQAIAEAAVASPGPLGRELGVVSRQVAHGAGLLAALEGLAERRPVPGVRLAVAALCLAVEIGGAQAKAVDGVAATLRDRLGVAAEVRALSSQARMSALVIGLAPLAFGGFAAATDPRTAQFVFHTPAGLALLAVGLSLDGAGWLWMQRLARVTA